MGTAWCQQRQHDGENRMNQHQLSIEARFRPEILERILRVVRHRGFQVCSMNMATVANTENINIEMTVASQRSVDLLSSQLRKLMDVACVQTQQQTSQQIRA
ncbi:Acetolactate synthase isozyme 2 small subunit [Pantoea ananatis]|nr:Acetolactate synthase isozyme 2 small subunit [Pantoea ananatis]CRH36759.1 Acetolactate synthase isozyme 2 small subunit [Pantoea ananatis]CRH40381.1 Acetolactate synthase isozyme 2 small subunit [Pantoea ananatis]